MKIIATTNFVWVVRDGTQTETSGLLIPTSGQSKPFEGTIISVGKLVADKTIKKGCKCLWHMTAGMNLNYDGIDYVVLESEKILSVLSNE